MRFSFPGLSPVFRIVRQADYLDPDFDAGGECDGSLTACAREGAGGGADLAGCGGYSRNEAEGFTLYPPPS